MALPADTVDNRLMLRNRIIHDVLNCGMTAQANFTTGRIQHGNIVSTMNAVTHLAVYRPDWPMHILTIGDGVMANHAEPAT